MPVVDRTEFEALPLEDGYTFSLTKLSDLEHLARHVIFIHGPIEFIGCLRALSGEIGQIRKPGIRQLRISRLPVFIIYP